MSHLPTQNKNDFVYLFLKVRLSFQLIPRDQLSPPLACMSNQGVLALGIAPTSDQGDEYAFDLTPVDFAAAAAVHMVLPLHQNLLGYILCI